MQENTIEQQNITIKNRNRIYISGVSDVESFNEQCVVAITSLGTLVVRGMSLHINKLDIENATLDIEGTYLGCEYLDDNVRGEKTGFFARLLK